MNDDTRIKMLVDRFLMWPLPKSVRSDLCVTKGYGFPRSGTNLLTADEARQMIEYLLSDAQHPLKCPGVDRDKDNICALQFYFSRPVSDDEMRFLHDVIERAVACMPKELS